VLEEEMDVRDSALYHSVLAAVAAGNSTRGGIANYVGPKSTDIGHHLLVLEDSGLLRVQPDIFRAGRAIYQDAELLVTFYQVVMPHSGPAREWARTRTGPTAGDSGER
jgi:hypothetical protein